MAARKFDFISLFSGDDVSVFGAARSFVSAAATPTIGEPEQSDSASINANALEFDFCFMLDILQRFG
jgi:hypothetical protein